MMSETPNRAAADLLPPDLLAPATREAILAAPAPALVLGKQGHVLFAAHAFARRLGFADGAALMRAGLPRLAPGTLRLLALAAEPPEAAKTERLRFAVGQQAAILPFSVAPLALNAGEPGLVAFVSDTVVALPDTAGATANSMASPEPAPQTEIGAGEPEPVASHAPALSPSPAPRPSRFVFSLDRDGAIETLSSAFHEALGGEPGMFLGQSMAHVAGALDPVAGLAIEKAVDVGTTWGGIRLNWPLPNGQALVPIILSAMPLHGAEGLKGFSGFGRILHDESRALKGPEPMAVAASTPAPPMPPVEAPQQAIAPSAPPLAEIPVACTPEDLERALIAFSEDDAEAIVLPAGEVSPAPLAPAAAQPEPEAPEAEPDITPPRAEPPATVAIAPAAPPPVEIEVDNVISLRPGALDLPQGLPPHLARPGLSMSERNAFREIARALGAKFEPEERDAPGDDVPAPQPPAPHSSAQDDLFNLVQLDAEPTPSASGAAPVLAPPAAAEAVTSRARATDEDGEEEVSLVDALPIGVLVLRGEEPLFANKTLLDLSGYPSFTGFVAAGGAQALFRKGTLPRESEDGFETVVLTTRRGEMIPVDAHLQIVEWDGAPASLIAFRRAVELEQGRALKSVAQDLKRVRAETAELRAVLDTATDGVLTLDETGAILSLNHAAEALFGLHQNEVAGSSFVQLLHNESHAAVLDYFEGLKANGVRSVLNDGREVAGREKKGGRIPLFLTFGRISDEEPRRFCAVLRDLTAWKRAETELTEARKSAETASAKKSDFLAKVGHEIRTPMNAIIGFAEVMQEERLGPIGNAKYKEYLGDIRTSGLHVVSLVNDLLDLSKIEAGRMELNFNATDINAVVNGCVGLIQPQATQHRVLVRSQLAAKLPLVVADERSIRQILLNLLSNATRFTPTGGQVLVATVLQETGEAIIRIRDTGVGMTPTEIEQALESYRQVGTKRENGGTGLGLPLSKALAEANRANFSIRSAPGEGTTVEISFPPTRVLAE